MPLSHVPPGRAGSEVARATPSRLQSLCKRVSGAVSPAQALVLGPPLGKRCDSESVRGRAPLQPLLGDARMWPAARVGPSGQPARLRSSPCYVLRECVHR